MVVICCDNATKEISKVCKQIRIGTCEQMHSSANISLRASQAILLEL